VSSFFFKKSIIYSVLCSEINSLKRALKTSEEIHMEAISRLSSKQNSDIKILNDSIEQIENSKRLLAIQVSDLNRDADNLKRHIDTEQRNSLKLEEYIQVL
jgi:hypothetical protein